MSNNLMLDVGQANELKLAFRRAGFSNDHIKRLCEGNVLADVKSVLLGHAAIIALEHVIDCNADPFVPEGWSVAEHRKGGTLKWDASQVELYLSSGQKNEKTIVGYKLRKELARKLVLNANVLDHLLQNPHLIPEEWKGKYVFFWGTVYRNIGNHLHVRYLHWSDGRWDWCNYWVELDWHGGYPAAVRMH